MVEWFEMVGWFEIFWIIRVFTVLFFSEKKQFGTSTRSASTNNKRRESSRIVPWDAGNMFQRLG